MILDFGLNCLDLIDRLRLFDALLLLSVDLVKFWVKISQLGFWNAKFCPKLEVKLQRAQKRSCWQKASAAAPGLTLQC